MENKSSLFIRYMKYWYGIYGPLDEYKRSEVERIGNNAFFMTSVPMAFVMLIAIIVDNLYTASLAYIIILFGWIIIELTSNFYISKQLKKLKLQVYEVENTQIAIIRKRIWITSWIAGLIFSVLMTASLIMIYHEEVLSFYTLIEFIFLMVGMALITGFKRTRHIKTVKEND